MMAQEGKAPLPMQEATSAPQGGGPKAANPAAMIQGLAAPSGPAPRPGAVDPRDEAVKEVSAKMQAKKTPPPAPPAPMAPSQGGIAGALMQPPPAPAPALNPMMQPAAAAMAPPPMPQVPAMAKGGMPEDAEGKGLAVMIGLGAPSYEEAAEGNPPPGATKEEVADDQLVLLSEGELVVPANVVRYHGLGTYEGMRRDALMGIQEMENSGQIEYVSGGKEKADPIDDNGGLVKAQAGTTLMEASPDPFKPRLGGPSTTFGRGPLFGPITTPEAASQQFVTTPTTSGTPRSGATTDTTPLTISDKPYTPTTDLTEVYAPNVDTYKESTDDGDDGDDGTAPPADPCPPGYKMNATTGVCEPVAPQTTAPRVREDDPSAPPEQPAGATAVFGGTSQNGRLIGATAYDFGLQSSEPGGFGIMGALLGGSDQVVLTDRNTGRKAVMAKSTYDAMKADRTNPENTQFIQQLMDTQAKIDADYAMGSPDQGFFSDIGGNKKKTYETTTAKSMAEGLGLDYTGQSLAEIMVIVDAQSQTDSDVTTTTAATPTGAEAPIAPALSSGLMQGPVTAEEVNYALFGLNSVFSGVDTFDNKTPVKAPVSLAQQMRALSLVQAGEAGSYTRTDGTVEGIDSVENMSPATAIAVNYKMQEIEKQLSETTTADVRRKFAEGIDEEAAGFESGFYDRQQDMADARAKFERDQQQDADDAATGRGNIVTDSRGRPVTGGQSGGPVTTRQGSALRNTPGGDDEINRQAEAMRRDADRREREETSRKNEEKMQQKIASGVDLEAAAYESGLPDDDNSSGKIVCTEMYRQTQLDDWARTMKIWDTYQKKYLTPIHEVGYHWLFKPYVRGMQNSGILTNVGAFFAQKRTQHLRHILTKGRAKDSFVGNVWCKIIHPIVYLVGKMVYKK